MSDSDQFESDSEQGGADQNNKLKMRQMSVLEKQYFDKAIQKHKDNLCRPPKGEGKCEAFLSNPVEIIFKDFLVGEPVSQIIYLTNVSNNSNSFRVHALSEEIRNFFDIFYVPSGKIATGTGVPLTIRFSPQLNEDIHGSLPLLAETGPINIPIHCYCQKAIVTIEKPLLDFNKVIYGEKKSLKIVFNNTGALTTKFQIKSENGQNLQQDIQLTECSVKSQHDQDQDELKQKLDQLQFDKFGEIEGYSKKQIKFNYKPSKVGSFKLTLLIYFDKFQYSPQKKIDIFGECVDVPIYIENEVIDLQLCLLNHSYREKLVFKNRGQNSMKVQILAPQDTKEFFEFNPLLGYIQGNSSFEIWLKVNANKEIFNSCSKYIEGDKMKIPFKLTGIDQLLPVNFQIQAQLTTDNINLSPSKLDFGKIYQYSSSRRIINFTNLSLLPQEFIFYPLPKNILLENDMIPIKILPQEELKLSLIYQGKEKKKEQSVLICKIITGKISTREIKIPFNCEVISCPLEFSTYKINYPVLQEEQSYLTNFEIKNNSKDETMIFEFFQIEQQLSGLTILPMVQKLTPGQRVQVNIEYNSEFKKLGPFTMDKIKEDKLKNKAVDYEIYKEQLKLEEYSKQQSQEQQGDLIDKKKKEDPKKVENKKLTPQQLKEQEEMQLQLDREEKQKKQDQLERQKQLEQDFNIDEELIKYGGKFKEFQLGTDTHSQHYTWVIPCYFKNANLIDALKNVTYIEITTVSVKKSLIVNTPRIQFGEIAVGERKVEEVLITNKGTETAILKSDQLPYYSGFEILNALRELKGSKTNRVVVCFEPHEEQPFCQKLRIYSQTTCVSVILEGNGVKPEVDIEPRNGLINIGAVFLGESSQSQFKIDNVSKFGISFKLRSVARGMQNQFGGQAISYIPSQGFIQKGQSIHIQVLFKPDRVGQQYYDYILVDVPNQKKIKYIYLYAKAFPRSLYLQDYFSYQSIPDLQTLINYQETYFDIIRTPDDHKIYSEFNNQITLQFKKINNDDSNQDNNKQTEDCFQRKIIIGNCKLIDPKMEKNGNYEIIMPKDDKNNYFSCDILKGVVTSNKEEIVCFTYKPQKMDPFIEKIEAFQNFGQWAELKAELKLSGGIVKPGKQDVVNFEIILRAYVNQI